MSWASMLIVCLHLPTTNQSPDQITPFLSSTHQAKPDTDHPSRHLLPTQSHHMIPYSPIAQLPMSTQLAITGSYRHSPPDDPHSDPPHPSPLALTHQLSAACILCTGQILPHVKTPQEHSIFWTWLAIDFRSGNQWPKWLSPFGALAI